MEQLAQLHIIRTDVAYRFRVDLPDGSGTKEYTTEVASELSERLRGALQAAAQYIQPSGHSGQGKRNGNNDGVQALGRLVFDTFVPLPVQEALRRLDLL